MKEIVVSIDPGPRNTGVVILDNQGRVLQSYNWDVVEENFKIYKRKHGKYSVFDQFQKLLTNWRRDVAGILQTAERPICLVELTEVQNIGWPFFMLIGYLHKWVDFHLVHPIAVTKYFGLGGLPTTVKKSQTHQIIAQAGYKTTCQHVADALLNYLYFKNNRYLFRESTATEVSQPYPQPCPSTKTEIQSRLNDPLNEPLTNLPLLDKKESSPSTQSSDSSPLNSPNQSKEYKPISTSEDLQISDCSPTMPKDSLIKVHSLSSSQMATMVQHRLQVTKGRIDFV